MKAIKITAENAAAIAAVLKAVNGKAEAHTYTSAEKIFDLVADAEKELDRICIPKTMRQGAAYFATSGGKVSSSYAKKAHTRTATFVCLARRSSGWVMVDACSTSIWQQGGNQRLILTKKQHEEAIARFKASLNLAA